MSISNSDSADIRCNQEVNRDQRCNLILKGINRIINTTLQGYKKEELINTCLSAALEITDSQIGFIGEIDIKGLLHEVDVSNKVGNQYTKYNKSDHQHPQRDFILNGLYGGVIENRMSYFSNYPLSCSDSIDMPDGHPLLTSFLGAPLLVKGKAIGMLAVANREGGYSYEQREDLEAIAPAVTQAFRRIKEECEHKQAENALHDAYEQIQAQSDELQMQSDELQVQNEILQAQSEELDEANCALIEGEERFRTMANAIPQLAWIARADGYIYWYNERWYAYTGTIPEQMEGWGWQCVHDPAVLPKVLEQWKASIATGQPFDMEFPLRGANGIFRPFLTRVLPLKDTKGQVLQWFGTNTDVTERKRMEEELKQKVKQYQTLGDTIPYGVWITDAEGYCTYASDSFLELMDMTMEQVQKFGWMDRLPPEDVKPTTDHWLHSVHTGEDFEREHRFRAKDGSYRNVLAIGRPVRDDEGRITEWVGLNLDVTERRKMEEALRLSEERYRGLFESSVDGIIITDLAGKILKVNPAYEKMLGYSMEELRHLSYQQLTPVRWHESEARIVQEQIFEHGYSDEYEKEYIRKDGSIFPISIRVWLFRDKQGQSRGMWGIIRDITERKRAEEALKKAHEALEEKVKERTAELEKAYDSLKDSEKSLAEAQKMTHIGNWSRNLVTGDLYWSDEMYRIFGRNPQEVAPDYNVLLNYIHPEDRDYMDKTIKRALNGESYSTDHRIILHDGEERTFHVQAEVVFDEKNIPVRIIGTTQDITERKRSEESLLKQAALIDLSPDAIIVRQLDGTINFWSKGAQMLYGWTSQEAIGQVTQTLLKTRFPQPLEQILEQIQQTGRWSGELIHRTKDNKQVIVQSRWQAEFDDQGNMKDMLESNVDITKRKKAEEELAKIEIARKQEIHHRIKNNLQVISSLLDLQAEQFRDKECIKDSEVLEAFRESQDRVISMALIHEELYKGGGFETLNFSPYIKELAENLLQTYNFGNTDINLNLNLEDNVFFDMDVAVPLGMIVNELVTNSLKHAFPDKMEGKIQIKLSREENDECIKCKNEDCNNTFILTVSDNGIGVPEELDIEDLDTLGMQLVTSLVDQLDGELELKRNKGTEFIIRFTVNENTSPTLVD